MLVLDLTDDLLDQILEGDETRSASELIEHDRQLQPLGSLIATADIATVVQYQTIGMLVAPLRYGMPVVLNSTGQAFQGDAVTMYVALVPYTDQIVA